MARKRRIGELLVAQGAVTEEQLAEGLQLQKERGGKICQVLINLGYLTEESLLEVLGSTKGVVSVKLRHYTIDPDLTEHIPKEFAIQHEVMPLDKLGRLLTVAMAVPLDTATQEALQVMTGLRIRAILCSRSDVHAAITQYYGEISDDAHGVPTARTAAVAAESVQIGEAAVPEDVLPGPESIRLKGVLHILETVDAIPLLPEVHQRLMERLDDPEVSMEELSILVEQDPTLATNVLRLANSAAYAATSAFDSVQRAIAFVGLRELRGIVVGAAVLETISAEAGYDLNRMFLTSFHCALLTRIVVDAAKGSDRNVAFTAGLLHNLGEIVIRIFSAERAAQVDTTVQETGRPRHEVEEELLGIAGSEAGYHLATRWSIPENLAQAIRFHDRLDRTEAAPPLAVAVALALRCIEHDDRELTFGDPAADAEFAALLGRAGLAPTDVPRMENTYRAALEHLTRLDPNLG